MRVPLAVRHFMAAGAAWVTKGFQAGPQLWLFAPQHQTADCAAALGVQDSPGSRAGLGQTAPNFALPVLRRSNANRAKAHAPTGARSSARRDLGRGCDAVAEPSCRLDETGHLWLAGRARSKNQPVRNKTRS